MQNPILIANALLNRPEPCLAGCDAEEFAALAGIEMSDPASLISDRAKEIARESLALGPSEEGTVGAVALDRYGNLAAASSSGGPPNKHPGRFSDSCMPGIGAYASSQSAAVACTGHTAIITRLSVARDIAAFMELRNASLDVASRAVCLRISRLGGFAGFIALSPLGDMVVAGGSEHMSWAAWNEKGESVAMPRIPCINFMNQQFGFYFNRVKGE